MPTTNAISGRYLLFKKRRNKEFPHKQKLWAFITTRYILEEMLKGVLKVETVGYWTATQMHYGSIKLADRGKYMDKTRIR